MIVFLFKNKILIKFGKVTAIFFGNDNYNKYIKK